MFATFPSFSKLDYAQERAYRSVVSKYPPISDLSFSTLMIWWNFARDLSVANLNDNLVLTYHLPGDEQNSGLSLIGTNQVDESIWAIFKHQKDNNQLSKLVHVPHFVVDALKDPRMFTIEEERDYNEYIVPSSNLFPLEKTNHNMRRKIKKFLLEAGDCNITFSALDLSDSNNQDILLDAVDSWWNEFGAINDRNGSEKQALQIAIRQANTLGISNLCLYVCGKLEGFALYQKSHDDKFLIVNHMKVHYVIPRIFDFLTYAVATEAANLEVPFLNMEMDLGIPGLRAHKNELKPTDFFIKYSITPNI